MTRSPEALFKYEDKCKGLQMRHRQWLEGGWWLVGVGGTL